MLLSVWRRTWTFAFFISSPLGPFIAQSADALINSPDFDPSQQCRNSPASLTSIQADAVCLAASAASKSVDTYPIEAPSSSNHLRPTTLNLRSQYPTQNAASKTDEDARPSAEVSHSDQTASPQAADEPGGEHHPEVAEDEAST